ncbi:MAG: Gfo/Idh/MocA family oxidoreductase [Lachnospiraceae bacterium]|nr:Gfo/Idh/MocA family oxidoreductase [Lachnospiraceae bacterium]
MKNVNYAILGCGAIAKTHIKALAQVKNAKLYAVCDKSMERVQAAAEQTGAVPYTDMDEMLKDKEVDAVIILTASGMHADMGMRAANAGKHVIVEKPIDISVKKARCLIETCDKNGVTLSCIFQHRYDEDTIALKEAVKEGRLGRLDAGCCHTKWYRGQAYYDEVDWRGTKKYDGGGALMNQGIHQLDYFQYVMGEVDEVFAYCATRAHERIDVEDLCMATLKFKNGALGILEASTVATPGFYTRIDINGSKGTVILQNNTIQQWKVEGEEERQGTFTELPHRLQLQEITDSILAGRPSLVNGREAVKVLCLAEAIYRSAESGRPEKVIYE